MDFFTIQNTAEVMAGLLAQAYPSKDTIYLDNCNILVQSGKNDSYVIPGPVATSDKQRSSAVSVNFRSLQSYVLLIFTFVIYADILWFCSALN